MSTAKKIRKTTKKKQNRTATTQNETDNLNQKQQIYTSVRRDVPSITVEDGAITSSTVTSTRVSQTQSHGDDEIHVVYRHSRPRGPVHHHSTPDIRRRNERPQSASMMYYGQSHGPRIYQSVNRSESRDHPHHEHLQDGSHTVQRTSEHVSRHSKKQAIRSHSASEMKMQENVKKPAVRSYSEGDKQQWLMERKTEAETEKGSLRRKSHRKGLTLDEVQLQIRPSEIPHRPVVATMGNFRGQIMTPEGIRHGVIQRGSNYGSTRSSGYGRRNKEEAVTYFAIRFLNNDTHVYHPGEVVEGHVILDTCGSFTVLGIDLVIRARGALNVIKDGAVSHRKSELYLEKTSRMLGRNDGRMVMITPGHYVSNFTYQLPTKLPASILSENSVKGLDFKVEVTYTIQAVIFDEMYKKVTQNHGGSPHVSHVGLHLYSGENYQVVAKPIKICRREFKVVSLPETPLKSNILQPAYHTEYLNGGSGIMLMMDSTIVYPGSEAEIHLDADDDIVKMVGGIKVELMQRILIPHTHHDIHRSLKEEVHNLAKRKRSGAIITWDIPMKMPHSLTPTYKEIVNLVQVEYSLKVTLKLPRKKLFLEIPIQVNPIPKETEPSSLMPDFRMVTRYPHLSHNKSKDIENGLVKPDEVRVKVDYQYNSWLRRNMTFKMCNCLE